MNDSQLLSTLILIENTYIKKVKVKKECGILKAIYHDILYVRVIPDALNALLDSVLFYTFTDELSDNDLNAIRHSDQTERIFKYVCATHNNVIVHEDDWDHVLSSERKELDSEIQKLNLIRSLLNLNLYEVTI